MTALAWPLVVLLVGLAFAVALALYLLDKRRLLTGLEADNARTAAEVAAAVAKTLQLAAAGEALARRVVAAEDQLKVLEQRMLTGRQR